MPSQDPSTPQTTLICWLGDTDLLALGKAGLEKKIERFSKLAKSILFKDKEWPKEKIDKEIEALDTNTRNSSIVLTLNNANENGIPCFSNVILLTNRPSNDSEHLDELKEVYPNFLRNSCTKFNGNVVVEFVPNHTGGETGVNGWDYQEVLVATRDVLKDLFSTDIRADQTWYNVTPGTMAQSTALILLGKEFSNSSNFIQVEKSRNRVEHCQIPFDIRRVIDCQARFIESQASNPSGVIGRSPSFAKAMDKAKKVAQFPVTVLLTGESGTGKEVFAHAIHEMSGRKGKFVAINCAMLDKGTGMTELTGVFKGAFTDAQETRPGKFHEAIGGTLFLDEIGDCPIDMQAELLRFLQPSPSAGNPSERRWRLKGSEPKRPTQDEKKYLGEQKGDIRIIAATNRNLQDHKAFRQDLYYRIETIQIKIPNLETRKAETDSNEGIDDLKELADMFLSDCNKKFSRNEKFHETAYNALRVHKWTGNVRELQNVITRAVLLTSNETITAEDIKDNLTQDGELFPPSTTNNWTELVSELAQRDIAEGGKTFEDRKEEFSHEYCVAALHATNGNMRDAYTQLKMSPHTFSKYINIKA